MTESALIVTAGAVVLRRSGDAGEVLLIHRPKYDDWSLPKGKLDPGEDARTAAVREVLEETGATIRLGPRLSDQAYSFGDGTRSKQVHSWVGRVKGDYDISSYQPNDEVDELRWVRLEDAAAMLSYPRDRDLVKEAEPFVRKSHPLIVLRHAAAQERKRWHGDDQERPLSTEGRCQAERLVPTLAAYGIERLVSSSSARCWTTLAPYAIQAGLDIEETDTFSEEGATEESVGDEVDWLVDLRQPVVVCSHRPVLPLIFEALGVDPPCLEPAAMMVVHHRQGRITAIERIPAPPVPGPV